MPFRQFGPFLKLQDANFDYDMSQFYSSDKQCKVFTTFIAEVYRKKIQDLIHDNDFVGTLNDSSIDTGVTEQELVAEILNQLPCFFY